MLVLAKFKNEGLLHVKKITCYLLVTPIICLLYIRFPILITLISFIFLVAAVSKNKNISISFVIFLITSILCWINSGKYLAGDLTWYYDHFILLNKISIFDYLGTNVNQFTIKSREPFYYTISFIISRATGGNTLFLNLFITIWIYLLTGFSFSKIINCVDLSNVKAMTVVAAAMLTGITFSLTTHLVRQEFSAAALLYCSVSLFLNHKKSALIFGIISATCHESVYIPLFCLVIGYYYQFIPDSLNRLKIILVLLFICTFFGSGLYYSNNVAFDSPYQRIRSDGDISINLILLDATLYLIVLLHSIKNNTKVVKLVALMVALYISFLAGISTSPLPFLRMYFYMDIIRGCEVAYISIIMLRSSFGLLWIAPIIFTAILYAELRIISSGFNYYGGGIIGHLLFPLFFI